MNVKFEERSSVVEVGSMLKVLYDDIPSTKFCIRPFYDEVYDSLPDSGNIAFVGTPGIAKSVSLLLVLIKRGHSTCFHRLDSNKTWLFANGTCRVFLLALFPILNGITMRTFGSCLIKQKETLVPYNSRSFCFSFFSKT